VRYEQEMSTVLSTKKPKGKCRPASKRALLALELHTQLSRRGYYIDDDGNRTLDCTPNGFPGDVNIPMSLKLIERVQKYLLHDCPRSLWQMPDFREHDKAYRTAEEAKLTLSELAKARGIDEASAERRIKRRARQPLKKL
jgi:hypothetical protein